MTNQEIDEFRNQRINSDAGQAVIEQLTNDGTAGHSKGNWYSHNRFVRVDEDLDGNPTAVTIAEANTSLEEYLANSKVLALAQSAPHDCGDPECPGFQNKRKLELYDKFQRAIHEFAEAGLLT